MRMNASDSAIPDILLSAENMKITDGTSDGTQIKFYKDNIWYKMNTNGYEGEAECLASLLLSHSNCKYYVSYFPCRINRRSGCYCANFLEDGESFLTLERLYHIYQGGSLSDALMKIPTQEGRIDFTLHFVKECTGLQLKTWLSDILLLDCMILNDDRHLNNLGIIWDGQDNYRIAPVFDNGAAFLSNYAKYPSYYSLEENLKKIIMQPFTGSLSEQWSFAKDTANLKVDWSSLYQDVLAWNSDTRARDIMLHQIELYHE